MNFTNDPLLNYPTSQEIQSDYGAMMQQLSDLRQKQQVINLQANVSQTPLWDEIDKIEDGLTDNQRQAMMGFQEYADSLHYVSKLVQDEILRIVRPRIENTKTGADALTKHLDLTRRIKKEITKSEEKRSELLNEYLTKYGHMTWNEFISMKEKGVDK